MEIEEMGRSGHERPINSISDIYASSRPMLAGWVKTLVAGKLVDQTFNNVSFDYTPPKEVDVQVIAYAVATLDHNQSRVNVVSSIKPSYNIGIFSGSNNCRNGDGRRDVTAVSTGQIIRLEKGKTYTVKATCSNALGASIETGVLLVSV